MLLYAGPPDAVPSPAAVRAANFIQSEVLRDVHTAGLTADFPVSPVQVAELLRLVDRGAVSGKQAKEVYALMRGTATLPATIVRERGMTVLSDVASLTTLARDLVAQHPKQAESYRAGKVALLGFFVGQMMKQTAAGADPGDPSTRCWRGCSATLPGETPSPSPPASPTPAPPRGRHTPRRTRAPSPASSPACSRCRRPRPAPPWPSPTTRAPSPRAWRPPLWRCPCTSTPRSPAPPGSPPCCCRGHRPRPRPRASPTTCSPASTSGSASSSARRAWRARTGCSTSAWTSATNGARAAWSPASRRRSRPRRWWASACSWSATSSPAISAWASSPRGCSSPPARASAWCWRP